VEEDLVCVVVLFDVVDVDLLEEEDVVMLIVGTMRICPTKILLSFIVGFNSLRASSVVLWLRAIR